MSTMSYKKIVTRVLLGLEVVIFFGNYLVSGSGLQAIQALQQENNVLNNDIVTIKNDLHHLENELDLWNTYPFYKEKIAREQLHMTKNNEFVYYIS